MAVTPTTSMHTGPMMISATNATIASVSQWLPVSTCGRRSSTISISRARPAALTSACSWSKSVRSSMPLNVAWAACHSVAKVAARARSTVTSAASPARSAAASSALTLA